MEILEPKCIHVGAFIVGEWLGMADCNQYYAWHPNGAGQLGNKMTGSNGTRPMLRDASKHGNGWEQATYRAQQQQVARRVEGDKSDQAFNGQNLGTIFHWEKVYSS